MRILIFGAGALGSLAGALLSRKNDVTLLGRQSHIDSIKKKGLKVTGLEEFIAHPSAVSDIRDVEIDTELVILTVKSYDTAECAGIIKRKFPDSVPVLSLQNGLGNIESLSEALGKERVIGGLTSHGVTFMKNGWVHHAGTGDTVFGESNGKMSKRLAEISRLFSDAGIKNRTTGNIHGEAWAKAIVNAGINPLTAIMGIENGRLLKDRKLGKIMDAACMEGVAVAKGCKITLPGGDMTERTRTVARLTARNRSSMLQDIDNGKRTEIDAINSAIVSAGKKAGVETPVNAVLVALVRAIEKRD